MVKGLDRGVQYGSEQLTGKTAVSSLRRTDEVIPMGIMAGRHLNLCALGFFLSKSSWHLGMAGPGQKLTSNHLRTPLINDQQKFTVMWSYSLWSSHLHREHLNYLNQMSCALQGQTSPRWGFTVCVVPHGSGRGT